MLRSVLSVTLALALLAAATALRAQISTPAAPRSAALALKPPAVAYEAPAIDRARIDAEDARDDAYTQPRRVAFPFAVQLDMKSGEWTDLPDGGRVWRLAVRARGAQAISLLYDRFYLPPGATMHVYNPRSGETLGAFTARNHKPDGKFATALTYGDEAVVEYYEPAAQRGRGEIRVSQVGHAYRLTEVLDAAERAAVNSGACQVGVNCSPEGDAWQDHKRSVARILMNGTGLCTGSLLNNTAVDGKPLFLTADHCIGSLDALGNANASGFVFYWDYERTACGTAAAPTATQTTNGATLRANDSDGDFALFELTEDPNAAYGVYFAGFSAAAAPPPGGVGIHHPAGDYKMIATHSIAPVSFSFGGRPADSYWNISWDATANGHSVTEGGSSGSPLFDAAGLVIGQLYGGSSINCSDPANDPGWYGKIAYNWDNGAAAQPERRLRDWLDPVGGGATTTQLGGYVSPPPPSVSFTGPTALTISEAAAAATQDCRGYVDLDIPVALSGVATGAVTVGATAFGSAGAYDVELVTANVTLGGAGNPTAGNLVLRVFDDEAIEPTETVELSLTASGQAGLGTQTLLTVTVEDDDQPVGGNQPSSVLNAGINAGLPAGWAIANAGAAAGSWGVVNDFGGNSLDGTAFLFADSDAPGSGTTTNTTFTTAPIDVSGATAVTLTFDEYFRVYTAGGPETATVEVLANGAWVQVLQHTETGGSVGSWATPAAQSVDLTAFASAALQIRFRYEAAYDWYWAIDNIAVAAELPDVAATAVSAPAQSYLGPDARIVLRDPVTRAAIAEVTNLTATDHGCLTYEIDRDASAQPAFAFHDPAASQAAFAKTLRLQPTLSPSSGEYALRWFFTPAEIAAWETATGQTYASAGGIAKVSGSDPFGAVTPATFANYSVDWTAATRSVSGSVTHLDATFVTGFSAFGIVVDPAAVPLPVELTALRGHHVPALGNVISWTTEREVLSDRFEVEAGRDGVDFRLVGTVEAAGTTASRQDYEFVDPAPAAGITYYRLRQVDLDGTDDLSQAVAVRSMTGNGADHRIKAWITAPRTIALRLPAVAQSVSLVDATGRRVATWTNLPAGLQELRADAHLTPGTYVLDVQAATGTLTQIKIALP